MLLTLIPSTVPGRFNVRGRLISNILVAPAQKPELWLWFWPSAKSSMDSGWPNPAAHGFKFVDMMGANGVSLSSL